MPSAGIGGHFGRWHTGDGEALPPLDTIVTQLLDHGVHHVVVLAGHALGGGCLATLAVLYSGAAIGTVELDTVEGEGGHGLGSFDVFSLQGQGVSSGGWWSLAHLAPSGGDLVDLLAG